MVVETRYFSFYLPKWSNLPIVAWISVWRLLGGGVSTINSHWHFDAFSPLAGNWRCSAEHTGKSSSRKSVFHWCAQTRRQDGRWKFCRTAEALPGDEQQSSCSDFKENEGKWNPFHLTFRASAWFCTVRASWNNRNAYLRFLPYHLNVFAYYDMSAPFALVLNLDLIEPMDFRTVHFCGLTK